MPKQRGGARPGSGRPATGINPQINLRVRPHIADAVRLDRNGAREALRIWAESKEPTCQTKS